jgi:uncharacterized protein YkwD
MKDQIEKAYSKRLFIILSLFFLTMTIALTVVQSSKRQNLDSSAASEITDCTVSDTLMENDAEEKKVLTLINNYREAKGLDALTFQEDLNRSAAWQSKDMSSRDKLDHTDSTGREFIDRVQDCGFKPFTIAKENIGEGQATADEIFTGWKKSAEHNENMLCEECTQIGLARDRQGTDGTWYWTMDIGTLLETEPTEPEVSETPSVSITESPEPTDSEQEPEITLPPAKTQLPEGTSGIFISVNLSGIDYINGSPPVHPNRPLTLTILTPDNKELTKVDGIVSYDTSNHSFNGAIELPDTIQTGTYIVKMKTERSLTKIINSGYMKLEKGKVVNVGPVMLQNVDLDENNSINFADVLTFRKCLNDKSCPAENVDLNDDGDVNLADYAVFLLVFGLIQGQ